MSMIHALSHTHTHTLSLTHTHSLSFSHTTSLSPSLSLLSLSLSLPLSLSPSLPLSISLTHSLTHTQCDVWYCILPNSCSLHYLKSLVKEGLVTDAMKFIKSSHFKVSVHSIHNHPQSHIHTLLGRFFFSGGLCLCAAGSRAACGSSGRVCPLSPLSPPPAPIPPSPLSPIPIPPSSSPPAALCAAGGNGDSWNGEGDRRDGEEGELEILCQNAPVGHL